MRGHTVRVGALGNVGRFMTVDAVRYPRGSRVIVRTARGLEIGTVLTAPEALFDAANNSTYNAEPVFCDGELLRGMTVEDELLSARLERNREAAYEACSQRVAVLGLDAVLMDVEHLFDGQTLVFYFLGETDATLAAIIDQLAETYDAQAQFRAFADAVATGCGPDCGTDAATGCGSCSTGCAVASACRPTTTGKVGGTATATHAHAAGKLGG